MRAVIRGGCYVGCGILGKRYIDSEVSLGLSSTIGTVSPFELVTANGTQYSVFPSYKRFDTGLTFGIDLFYDRYFLSCDYQHGLVELVSYNNAGNIKNRNLVFSAGVIF